MAIWAWPVLPELQGRFAESLLAKPGGALDVSLAAAIGDSAIAKTERFAVYRNNAQSSLIGVLRAVFPVTADLAGAENFAYAARRFLCTHPPNEARLLAYGAEFPAWLAAFEPAAKQPWLAEMARLEWARNEALFAADAAPLDPKILSELPPERVGSLCFVAHPATRLVASDFALNALWCASREAQPRPDPTGAETVLVLRPNYEVTQLLLSPGEAKLTDGLRVGRALSEAAMAALKAEADLDLQTALYRHLRHGTFSDYRLPESGA